jgi:hypothetical protein
MEVITYLKSGEISIEKEVVSVKMDNGSNLNIFTPRGRVKFPMEKIEKFDINE